MNSKLYFVSIIMPCFNVSFFSAEVFERVLRQAHTNLELIIINDGYTGDSEGVIKTFNDEWIRYFS